MTTAAALDALADKLAGIERRATGVEATPDKTAAYVDLLFGLAFARITDAGRAHARFHAARDRLAPWIRDPVHELLVAAFTARLGSILAGSPHAPWAADMLARLDGADRVSRYKVDRVREALRLFDPDGARIDPMARFELRRPNPVKRELPRLVASPTDAQLYDYFDSSAQLGDSHIDLARAVELLSAMPDASIDTYFAAATAAWRRGWPELVDAVIHAFQGSAAREAAIAVPRVLIQLARAVGPRDADARGYALDIIRGMGESCPPEQRAEIGAVIAHEESRPNAKRAFTMTQRLEQTRVRATSTRSQSPDAALAEILVLADDVREITDSFGTNSHYCLSVLYFVDALLWALVEREVP